MQINKQFIVGLSSMEQFGNFYQLEDICSKYKDNILSWYISPPFKEEYASRKYILTNLNFKTIEEIANQIQIIKEYNQSLQLALNGTNLLSLDKTDIINDFKKWLNLFERPDSIVLLDELIPYFLNFEIPLTYSYNNNLSKTKLKNLNKCNTIVLGDKYLRNINFMYKLKEKYNNINIELLLNNGCHTLCEKSCYKCYQLQAQRLTQVNKYYALAEQSLLPSELKLYPSNLIDLYKISSRPCSYEYLNKVLNFYIQQNDINTLSNQIDLTNIQNWSLFCRLEPIRNMFSQNEKINLNQIIDYKYQIWSKILHNTNFIL